MQLITPPSQTSKVLREAAKLIETRGLSKNFLEDSKGRLCVNGAINMAFHGNSEFDFDGDQIASRIARTFGKYLFNQGITPTESDPSYWNNRNDTTQEDVVKHLIDASVYYEGYASLLGEY